MCASLEGEIESIMNMRQIMNNIIMVVNAICYLSQQLNVCASHVYVYKDARFILARPNMIINRNARLVTAELNNHSFQF